MLMSWVCKMAGGQWVDPDKLNPYAVRAARPRQGPVSEEESKLAFKAIGMALKQLT